MKKMLPLLLGLLLGLGLNRTQAQAIYMKLTPFSGTLVTANMGPDSMAMDNGKNVSLKDYIRISSLQYDFEQTLNIGAQATGVGAGKIAFNPLVITKVVDQTSATLFQYMASGTPFEFIEFIIVQPRRSSPTGSVLYKVLLKLAAVKTMSVSSVNCSTGCSGIAESVSFDYGGYIVTTYTLNAAGDGVAGGVAGWNRVKNISDIEPSVIIK